MKAVRIHSFGDTDVMKLEQVSDPKPGPGQVLVRVKAAGVNPVDTYIRSGKYGDRPFPFTLGMDAGGVIETIGPGVEWAKAGDRVYVSSPSIGAYAELLVADHSQVHPLPANVSFAQGAGVGVPYSTAYFALSFRGHAAPGETVLVHGGSGSVGIAAIQIAHARGLVVIGTGGTARGRELVAKEGAHHVLDHHAPDYMSQIVKLTGGRGVNLILEMMANVNLGKDLQILAPRGRVVVVGSRGKVEIDPRDTMGRHADIRGMSLLTVAPDDLASVHAALGAGLEDGTFRPILNQEMPLSQAAKAHEEILKAGAYGKIVLIP